MPRRSARLAGEVLPYGFLSPPRRGGRGRGRGRGRGGIPAYVPYVPTGFVIPAERTPFPGRRIFPVGRGAPETDENLVEPSIEFLTDLRTPDEAGRVFIARSQTVTTTGFDQNVRPLLAEYRSTVGAVTNNAQVLSTRLRGLRIGQSIRGTDGLLNGLTVREIRDLCVLAGLDLRQMYLTGNGFRLRKGLVAAPNVPYQTANYNAAMLANFCLAEVDVLSQGNDNSLGASLSAAGVSDFLDWFMNDVQDEGSDTATIIMFENISISRRAPYPDAIFNARPQTRIAGFDKLIPTDVMAGPLCRSLSEQNEDIILSAIQGGIYSIYIPGGQENCVLRATIQGVYEAWLCHRGGIDGPNLDERVEQELTLASAELYVRDTFEEFRNQVVSDRLCTNASVVRDRGVAGAKKKFMREFNDNIRVGFSPNLMKKFIEFNLVRNKLLLNIIRFKSGAPTFELKDPYIRKPKVMQLSGVLDYYRDLTHVFIVECDMNGQVGSEQPPRLTHAITFSPYPPPYVRGSHIEGVRQLISSVKCQTLLKRTFDKFIDMSNMEQLDCDSALKLEQYVKEQNERNDNFLMDQARLRDQNVIDSFQPRENTSSDGVILMDVVVSDTSSSSSEEPPVEKRGICVVAYDCETVECLRGVQSPDVVYEPFICTPPYTREEEIETGFDNQWYHPVAEMCQIPYVIQWGVINPNNTELPIHPDEVKLCVGRDKLLGQCVDDFLTDLDEFCCKKGVKKVFAYAHNGSGFDAYLIKSFNTKFKIKDILVTPRGILSLSIQLSPGSEVIFRDTRVFFSASLAELCEVFNVPKQYCKTDFPITRIHARNCYNPNVFSAGTEYMINDVVCLGFVIQAINGVIQQISDLGEKSMDMGSLIRVSNPLYGDSAPPIAQFVTLMSCITRFQKQLFYNKYDMAPALPVDIPGFRKWLVYGNVGGRTTAYWRGFFAYDVVTVLTQFSSNSKEVHLKEYHKKLIQYHSGCEVWDATSLYPYVMFDYPMPTVSGQPIDFVTSGVCEDIISDMHCDECVSLWRLCEKHRCGGDEDRNMVGFVFMFIKFDETAATTNYHTKSWMDPHALNLAPRKLDKGKGLVYSFQTNEQLVNYHDGDSSVKFPEYQCYSMYDVYWLRRCGFHFTITHGVRFGTSYAFREYTHKLFQERIKAKQHERENNLPKSLSTFYKLFYNGGYGINSKKDIRDKLIIVDEGETEEQLRAHKRIEPDERLVLNTHSHQIATKQWILKIEKVDGACDTYAPQSACQIGAAVTACARHHMNLAMLEPAKNNLVGYTDTDSMALHATAIQRFYNPASNMYNESSSAPMGSYKNDHEEGKHERVILSLFVAKKVKLHITVDAEGDVRVYPTFKGYNPSRVDYETGGHIPVWMLEKRKAVAIVIAYFDGQLETLTQTEFKRSLTSGITIEKNSKFSASLEAFAGSCGVGTRFDKVQCNSGEGESAEAVFDVVETLIPHGSSRSVIETADCYFFENPECPRKSQVQMPEDRAGLIEENTSGVTKELLLDFLDRYYLVNHGDVRRGKFANESNGEFSAIDKELEAIFEAAPKLQPRDYFWVSQEKE